MGEGKGEGAAFTLAEVLITLAIIGVVAAMTIPTLVANYQTRTWNTSATVFERKLEEALKVMNTQSTLAGHTSTENFVEELSKHLKITKTCANDKLMDCFSETVFWGNDAEEIDMSKIKTAKDFGQNDWNTNIVGVQFANGVTGLIAYNPTESCKQDPYSNQIVGTGCLAILYDTTGYKTPNTSMKDIRNNHLVEKLGSETTCAIEVGGNCYTAPFTPAALTMAECAELKDSLGITNCYFSDEDYWGGAVKACGGVQNIPTVAQMKEIANILYGTTVSDKYDCPDGNTCWDTELAASSGFASIGLSSLGSEGAMLWTRDSYSTDEWTGYTIGGFLPQGFDATQGYPNYGYFFAAICINN